MESRNVERQETGDFALGFIRAVNLTVSPTAVELIETVMSSGLISNQVRMLFISINSCTLMLIASVLGTITNVINIIVFSKQGFQETVNISLLSLAISDLGSLLTLIWMAICLNPLFVESDIPFKSDEVQTLTAGFPHIYFTKVTNWVTAFITFERCLCVTLPLKVKTIVTKKVALSFNLGVFLAMIMLSIVPSYYVSYIDWKFYPEENRTLLGVVYKENREEVEQISLPISHFGVPSISFAIIITCTVIIAVKLKQKSAWREGASSVNMLSIEKSMSNRDRKTAVMIVWIASIFVVSFVPMTTLLLIRSFEDGFTIFGRYANIFVSMISVAFVLESVNSAVNIIVYYRMSTKYREVFRQIFCEVNKKVL